MATFLQLGETDQPLLWYESFLGSPLRGVSAEAAKCAVVQKRDALAGVWRQGYELAAKVFAATGSVEAVLLAGHVAHHFPLPADSLFDVGFSEFTEWTADRRLSADERFRWLCENWPVELARRVWQDGGRDLLAAVFGVPASQQGNNGVSYLGWHHEILSSSELCRPLRDCLILRPLQPPRIQPDNWFRFLKPPQTRRLMPPVAYSDGVVVAPHPAAEAAIKSDLVRGQRLLIVERVLDRLGIKAQVQADA